jgi:hypothetical protein
VIGRSFIGTRLAKTKRFPSDRHHRWLVSPFGSRNQGTEVGDRNENSSSQQRNVAISLTHASPETFFDLSLTLTPADSFLRLARPGTRWSFP